MTSKEIKAEIKATKKEMKERGIKTVSCFNGGLDAGTYRANARLFQLSVQLTDALKAEQNKASILSKLADDSGAIDPQLFYALPLVVLVVGLRSAWSILTRRTF